MNDGKWHVYYPLIKLTISFEFGRVNGQNLINLTIPRPTFQKKIPQLTLRKSNKSRFTMFSVCAW